jgi:hypothetical protein
MFRKKLIVIPVVLMLLSACYTTNVIPYKVAQLHQPRKLTTWSFLWGAIQDKRLESDSDTDCYGNGFSRVTVKTNFGFILLSVITLGTVVPQQIEYDCAKDGQVPPPSNLKPVPGK